MGLCSISQEGRKRDIRSAGWMLRYPYFDSLLVSILGRGESGVGEMKKEMCLKRTRFFWGSRISKWTRTTFKRNIVQGTR